MPSDASRPVALIAGASAGLGAVFARKLAARGYELILVARRKERLDALGAGITAAHGVACESLVAGLGDPVEFRRVGRRIAECTRLGVLGNKASLWTLWAIS